MSSLHQVTDSNFEREVLREQKPTIVGFWAPWSGAARLISSAMIELTERHAEEVKCVYVNVDADPRTPGTYAVKTLPTLLLFHEGEVVRRIAGAVPRPALEQLFEIAGARDF